MAKQSQEVGKVPADETTDRRMFLRSEPTDDGRSMCVSVLTKKVWRRHLGDTNAYGQVEGIDKPAPVGLHPFALPSHLYCVPGVSIVSLSVTALCLFHFLYKSSSRKT